MPEMKHVDVWVDEDGNIKIGDGSGGVTVTPEQVDLLCVFLQQAKKESVVAPVDGVVDEGA